MPESAASIGADFSNYRGNAGLGAINAPALNIDTKPLQELAQYTAQYNKSVWQQNIDDTNAKVKQLADLSNISLNDLRGKDKDLMTKKWTDFLSYASDFAKKQPKTQEEKLAQQLEWQTKYGAFLNDFNSGKQRAVAYQAHLNTIQNNTTNPARRDEQLSELNKQFDGTDIGTPISALPQYKMEDITVPNAINQKFDVIGIGGDQNEKITATIFNPAQNSGSADAAVLGISQAYVPKTVKDASGNDVPNPEYQNMSQSEKEKSDQQATVDSQAKLWNDMATPLNTVIQQKGADGKPLYFDAEGKFNEAKFESDNSSNSVIMRAYKALKSLNSYSTDMYNQSVNGMFNDKGVQYKLPPNVNPNDFNAGKIDFSKPITPNQLVLAGIYSQATPNEFAKTVTETGKATQVQIERENRASAERINANNIEKDKYIANLPYKKQKAGAVGADGQPLDFGNLIYGVKTPADKVTTILKSDGTKIPNVTVNNGVIVDKNGNVVDYTGDVKLPASYFDNSMITEFNKYSGTTKMAADGVTPLSTPSSSKLVPVDGFFKVRMQNGEIQGIETDDGTFASAQQFQHITMEAGQKGASKYKKADVNYGKFDNKQKVDEYGVPIQ